MRLDATGSPPAVTGPVRSVTVRRCVPDFDANASGRGQPWSLRVLSNPGDTIAEWIAAAPAHVQTIFGGLRIDLGTAVFVGTGTADATTFEPTVVLTIGVPTTPALAGVRVHAQAFAIGSNGRAWLSDPVSKTIQ